METSNLFAMERIINVNKELTSSIRFIRTLTGPVDIGSVLTPIVESAGSWSAVTQGELVE